MSIVIAVAGTKGGSGKTTICAALAVEAAKACPRVAIYDADPQKSITGFMLARARKTKNPAIFQGADTVTDAVEALNIAAWDFIFCDGLPGSVEVTEELIEQATVVIIPVRPSSLDLAASMDAVEMAREMGRPHLVVINAAARASASKLLAEARSWLFNANIPIAGTVITNRDAYASAMAAGKVGAETDKAAAAEIAALWTEVKALIRKPQTAAAAAAAKSPKGGRK